MTESIDAVINELDALPPDWHGAGSVGRKILRGIAEHAPERNV